MFLIILSFPLFEGKLREENGEHEIANESISIPNICQWSEMLLGIARDIEHC